MAALSNVDYFADTLDLATVFAKLPVQIPFTPLTKKSKINQNVIAHNENFWVLRIVDNNIQALSSY